MEILRFKSTIEWLAARKRLVTGSRVPGILGIEGAFGTPLSIWSEMVGLLDDDKSEIEERLWWGSKMEPVIAERLQLEAHITIERTPNSIVRHPSIPDFACSLDGVCVTGDGDRGIVEFKNVDRFLAEQWETSIPPKVHAQVQFNLDCTGLAFGYAAGCVGGNRLRWCRIERDQLWIDDHRPALLDFARRVREEDPPPPTGDPGDRAAIVARWPAEAEGKTVALPPDAIDLAGMYRDAKDAEKRAKTEADRCANALAVMLGDAETGVLPGDFGKVTFKTTNCAARVQEAYSFRAPRVWLKKEKAHG